MQSQIIADTKCKLNKPYTSLQRNAKQTKWRRDGDKMAAKKKIA